LCTIGRICNRCTGCVAMATLWKCAAEPSGNPPGPPHAARTTHACGVQRTAKTPLTGDKIDAPVACAVPFRPYCGGVVTRTENVSEYMLVLALCLVVIGKCMLTVKLCSIKILQFLDCGFRLMRFVLYNGRKTVVVLVVAY